MQYKICQLSNFTVIMKPKCEGKLAIISHWKTKRFQKSKHFALYTRYEYGLLIFIISFSSPFNFYYIGNL